MKENIKEYLQDMEERKQQEDSKAAADLEHNENAANTPLEDHDS